MADETALSELEERIAELESARKVEEAIQMYSRGVDANNSEALRSVFADDAVVEVDPWGTYEGIDEIMALFEGSMDESPLSNHFLTNQVVDVDGDRARTSSYFLTYNESPDHQTTNVAGFYQRRLERRDDEWVHTYLLIDIEFYRTVDNPSYRQVEGFDELQPIPEDDPHHPLPLYPDWED